MNKKAVYVAAIFIVLTLVAIGLGLGFGLRESDPVSSSSRISNKPVFSTVWRWECVQEPVSGYTRLPRCKKVHVNNASRGATSLNTCKLTCGNSSMLFPKPSGKTMIGNTTLPILPTAVSPGQYSCGDTPCSDMVQWLLDGAFHNFQETLVMMLKHKENTNFEQTRDHPSEASTSRKALVHIKLESNEDTLSLTTNESYHLTIQSSTDPTTTTTTININAATFFGARHALETVSQLMAYHEDYNSLQIVANVEIQDRPAYPYRGLLLDTSRNYFSVDSIKKLIRAMSYNKLNTLHWHITDTHSFPIEVKSVPELLQYGAYDRSKIYTHVDVKDIVNHAKIHGIRVLPEFDQPAHCGEGWQFGEQTGLGKLAVCVNQEPWQKYCVEPPCGQLNPTNINVYNVLMKIYSEYIELFKPDLFHAGGDEINFNCWNSTKEIADWLQTYLGGRQEEQIMEMWGQFLKNSSEKIYEANNNQQLPLILWTSGMTNDQRYLTRYMDPQKHIIQLWTGTTDNHIANIVKSGFKTIFSTYDTLYLDCGYGNWLVKGNNWCSPYKDWKLLYDNDPVRILTKFNIIVTEKIRESILGQEAAMWSEQVDENSSEGKIWPRTAALAERLWTNPDHDWREAEYRLIYHRERLVNRGIQADALQPLWCAQNEGHCYIDTGIKGEH